MVVIIGHATVTGAVNYDFLLLILKFTVSSAKVLSINNKISLTQLIPMPRRFRIQKKGYFGQRFCKHDWRFMRSGAIRCRKCGKFKRYSTHLPGYG